MHSFLQTLLKNGTEMVCKKAGSDVKSLRYRSTIQDIAISVILPEDPNNAIQDGKGMSLILSTGNGVQ